MKRILLLIFVFILAFSLAACDSDNAEVKETIDDTESAVQKSEEDFSDENSDAEGIKVHYLNVGQGDSIFIELAEGKTMLIDAGEKEYGNDIVEYITSLGYNSIDYLVGTHPHSDHIGGMSFVVSNLDIEKVFMPEIMHDTASYEKLLTLIDEKDIPFEFISAGSKIADDIDVVWPENGYETEDINELSAVIKLVYGDTSFLFTGDAGVETEPLYKGDISADVLKLGHHGSSTSTSEEFLNRVSPKAAIISCGANNDYGHPHKEIVKLLEKYDIPAYATYLSGNIVAFSDGKNIYFKCEPGNIIAGAVSEETAADKEEDLWAEVGEYVGNSNSKKFHISSCGSVSNMSEKNKVFFKTANDAISSGYEPCGSCEPK